MNPIKEGYMSPNFSITELGLDHIIDTRILMNYKYLCDTILEPIRAHFNQNKKEGEQEDALMVTSGYRNPLKNKSVGGKTTSYHMADGGRAATDFFMVNHGVFILFEWLRLESKLPFDKIILEYKNKVPMVVHCQIDRLKEPRRQAFIGQTGNGTSYQEVPVL